MDRAKGRTLVFFSSRYPGELTIANELAVVAPAFEHVFYVPTTLHPVASGAGICLPPNVSVVDTLSQGQRKFPARQLAAVPNLLTSVITGRGDRLPYARHPGTYCRNMLVQLRYAEALARFVGAEGLRDAVFYDYWFENVTLALALLRRRGIIQRCVARAHRFDLYDEPRGGWVVAFRVFKARYLDRIIPISANGAEYLRSKLPRSLHTKIFVSRLGVPDQEPTAGHSDPPLVVSCSHMRDFKQVHVIPEFLARMSAPVRWVHFGDGPLFEETRRKASGLPPHVQWELRGDVPHEAVIRFYRETPVSLFLSLSSSEGIPVSMMEALSFGIPVMGYRTCGIPELVTPTTGLLLEPDWSLDRIAKTLARGLSPGAFDRTEIVRFQRTHFSIRGNYEAFLDLLTHI